MRKTHCLLLVLAFWIFEAVSVGAVYAQEAPFTRGGTFLLHKFQQELGKETYAVERKGDLLRYTVDYKLVDRGSPVPLKAVIEVRGDHEPVSLYVKGMTSRMSTIQDSVVVMGASTRVKVGDSSYAIATTENSFPVAGFSPGTTQMLLLQYWKKHGQPAVIHSVPGGDIAIREAGVDAFTFNGRALRLFRYVISGLIWGNELLWADEQGQLFCLITNDAEGDKLEMMLEPYEALLPAIIGRAAAYGMQLFDGLTGKGSAMHALTAIVHARVADIAAGTSRPGMTILVENGKIRTIQADGEALPAGAFVVDAKGRMVLPGLWDMHAHFEQAEWGPAYLAAGVTTVRDCGNEFGYINAVQRSIDGGGIGPHILKAGIIDGKGSMSLGIVQASTAEEAVKLVRMYKDSGFVQIKIYSSVKAPVVKAICEEAHRLGLTVTGHIPNNMTLYQGVEAGMDMVNHEQYVNSLLKKTKDRTIDYSDPDNKKLIDFVVDHHVVIDPTLSVFEWVFRSLGDPVTEVEPAFYSIPRPLQALFVNTGMPARQAEAYKQLMTNMEGQVKVLYDRGVPVVAGTDMGIPGYSLYRELELYVKGGLTPQQALLTATAIPARVMKRDGLAGSIAVGKDADLILVDGDPLSNISDIRKVQLVLKGDQVYDCGELHRMVGFK